MSARSDARAVPGLRRTLAAALVLAALVATTVALGAKAPAPPARAATKTPAPAAARAPTVAAPTATAPATLVKPTASPVRRPAPAATYPAGPGQAIAERACLFCHSPMLVTQQTKDSTGWEKTLGQMEKWGAPVNPAEHDTLRGYLLARFGPRPAAVTAPSPTPTKK